jgi:heme-degrading monooxygenase HmoA
MPTLPWMNVDEPPESGEVVVMASRFRVRGYRHVLPFLLDALRIHAQVRNADGALGVSLVAHPLRKEFATLSAWRDRDALNALVRSEPHRTIMGRYRSAMAGSRFTFWEASPAALPLDWAEAERRLAAADPRPANPSAM